uniref:Uncharacterized protein n=1 Tax=Anguilla anguilla TaxID=7936 RepID=A0A0E9XJB5_ANGAN
MTYTTVVSMLMNHNVIALNDYMFERFNCRLFDIHRPGFLV